jgi:hypothetical protein
VATQLLLNISDIIFIDSMSDAEDCIIEARNIMYDEAGGIWKEVAVAGLKKKNLHCH